MTYRSLTDSFAAEVFQESNLFSVSPRILPSRCCADDRNYALCGVHFAERDRFFTPSAEEEVND